ncbi:MAG TPA: CAAX prenyl protease-related protein [Usitatibacter sp.]|nr:CAAX prenyl protease-related protein [Usitatibacter sp.]
MPALARIAPFALFIAFLAFTPLLDALVDPRWVVALRGVAVAAVLAFFWRSYTELAAPRRAAASDWALALTLGVAVFALWIVLDSGWAVIGEPGAGFVPLRADGSLDPALVALRLFGLVLVVPVMEELFWRSFVMRWIDRREFLSLDPARATPLAFALSSALFAVEHAQWFAGLLAGLAYGWLYMRSRNLWIPIVSHAITNGLLGFWILATRDWTLW